MSIKSKVYIFGAHSRAQTLAVYLQYLYSEVEIEAYLYDNEEENPDSIENIPVLRVDGEAKLHIEYPVYIGTRGVYHEKLVDLLEEIGFQEIYPVTVELDLRLRNAYLEKYYASIGRDFIKIGELTEKKEAPKRQSMGKIYVVKSGVDRPLQQEYQLAPYEKEIQAGAALAGEPLYSGILTDDTGDNISIKNKQYCELTALYWIWKHAKEDIVGLAHYRRHFILPHNWTSIMRDYEIDVILPVPLYAHPSIAENYRKRHDAGDWDYLMRYFKKKSVSLYEDAKKCFEGNLYSPCNMFIMRKEVLDEYCGWLFPILDAVAEHGGEKEDGYLNRYPGFISERLLTFFFEKNRRLYKIVYADKNFLA